MLTKKEILAGLQLLNDELAKQSVKGEVCLYGGAVMCVAFDARPSTMDVDAVFVPTKEMRVAIDRVGTMLGYGAQWMNDGVKGFLTDHSQTVFLSLPNIQVYIPVPDYLLAMKTLSARVDATDKDDVKFLIRKLGLKNMREVFAIVEKYYPQNQIRPATRFFIEELFAG